MIWNVWLLLRPNSMLKFKIKLTKKSFIIIIIMNVNTQHLIFTFFFKDQRLNKLLLKPSFFFNIHIYYIVNCDFFIFLSNNFYFP